MKNSRFTRLFVATLAFGLAVLPALGNEVDLQPTAGAVAFKVNSANGGSTLTVRGDNGFTFRRSFGVGQDALFVAPADGNYRWQLVVQPALSDAQKAELKAARSRQDETAELDFGGFVRSGSFAVAGGTVTVAGADVDQGWGDRDNPTRDQVIADDLIVTGSTCVGFDCVNNESFGFDTIRLKENNTRIKFEDTSTGSFPATDWQLTANDSASGGANKFSIEDITSAKVPFTVTGGAATNSIFVDSSGRVGFGTSTPVLNLHVNTSNTPAIRLEQNSSGGFTAQTWDMAGNEANFFVRDVTGGSRLPFRIRPGAPTSSIDIASSGNVGIGTASPAAKLDVSSTSTASATMLRMANNEALRFDFVNTSGTATTWFFQHDNNVNRTFRISKEGTGGSEVDINDRFDSNGGLKTMVVNGSVQATAFPVGSSRSWKTAGEKVDPSVVLEKIAKLDIEQWRFTHEPEGIRHIGPYAEDFKAAFGLGSDDKHIELTDAAGVSMVAIQALYREIQELKKQNAELREQLQPKN